MHYLGLSGGPLIIFFECYLSTDPIVEACILNTFRFTKDLKPQDINLSFFSGKGELNNLELDPNFLNEILQLPPWIEFQSAICDNIKAKVRLCYTRTTCLYYLVGEAKMLFSIYNG